MTQQTETVSNSSRAENEKALQQCVVFLNSIGIKTVAGKMPPGCFLPGLAIREGVIMYDPETLLYPGDILHEAGHIAVVAAADRATLDETAISKRENREAEEMMAIAWSYAACVHIGLDPYFVFHDDGYKGGGSYIADNFRDKKYFGLPMLQWIGLAFDEKNATAMHVEPYPHMVKWLRD